MTTDDMLRQLAEAGITLPDKSSAEDVEAAYIEFQAGTFADQSTDDGDDDYVKDPGADQKQPVEVEQIEPVSGICPIIPDKTLGDKDPKVVAWYRENAPDEYEQRSAGRNLED